MPELVALVRGLLFFALGLVLGSALWDLVQGLKRK